MSAFPASYPDLAFNYLHPARTSPDEPQNLLRPTNKGCGCGCGAGARPCANSIGLLNNGVVRAATQPFAGLLGLGEGETDTQVVDENGQEVGVDPVRLERMRVAYMIWGTISVISGGLCAYHGYKRNDSIGWAIGWYFLGAWFPFITLPVALAQGYAVRARGTSGIRGFNGRMRKALKRSKKSKR